MNYDKVGMIYPDGSEINVFVPLTNIKLAPSQSIRQEDIQKVISLDKMMETRR